MKLKELIEKLNNISERFGDDLDCIVSLEELGSLEYDLQNVYVSAVRYKGNETRKLCLFAPLDEDEDMMIFQKE